MIIEILAVIIGIVILVAFGLYLRSQITENEEADTNPILINHMKAHSDGHVFLKVVEKQESEKRVKFICYPRDLNRDKMVKLSKGKKFEPYVLFFDKKFVDVRADFSDYVPVIEAYPDKIEDLSESDKNDPRVIERIIQGNKSGDMFKLMKARQEELERVGINLAGGKMFAEYQESMNSLFKDKNEVNTIFRDKDDKK